ncbi:4137_t:CDS:2 [Paraglomus brasilianum]|uniref:4137_t:CDS:1 n=1 Tax=Paraglomus brasilianum TaxID=144538 RepID=A0A9N9CCD5_9GLOM|nr:4137_t:CDS:2 [Paraglomus brasilianum]
MSTSQTRPKTPPTEYGPSLTPPTLEEINICHLSIDVELSENTDNAPPLAVADNDSNRGRSGHLPPWVFLILTVNILATAAIGITLIQLIIYANHYEGRRPALIAWCIAESLFRLWAVYFAVRNFSATYTIIHSLGIFLGQKLD